MKEFEVFRDGNRGELKSLDGAHAESRPARAENRPARMRNRLACLPNALTVSRFFLTVLFVGMLAGMRPAAAAPAGLYAVYVFICLSDVLDGMAARALRAESELGGVLDVLADSLFIFSAFAFFNLTGVLPVWFTALVLGNFLVFLTTSRLLGGKEQGHAKRAFVFDTAGRAAAVCFYAVPIAACALRGRPGGVWEAAFHVFLGLTAALAAVSVAGRCAACLTARRRVGADTDRMG